MKIIKRNEPEDKRGTKITCDNCKSELEYLSTDIVNISDSLQLMEGMKSFIFCPVCNHRIAVDNDKPSTA